MTCKVCHLKDPPAGTQSSCSPQGNELSAPGDTDKVGSRNNQPMPIQSATTICTDFDQSEEFSAL